jgi:hypothetical protein
MIEIFTINVGDADYVVRSTQGSYYIIEGEEQLTRLTFVDGQWQSVPTMSPLLTQKLGEAIEIYKH